MELNKTNWTDITGEELIVILDSLETLRKRLSTREWTQLPIRYSGGNKGIEFDFIIRKNKNDTQQ